MNATIRRIPGTLRDYTKTVSYRGVTIYKTQLGWQMPMEAGGDPWLATKPSLKKAKAFVDSLLSEVAA